MFGMLHQHHNHLCYSKRVLKWKSICTVIMTDSCVVCNEVVRPRQEAVACDVCSRWTHRKCNTGIDRVTYRNAVQGLSQLPFLCQDCSQIQPEVPCEEADMSMDVSAVSFTIPQDLEEDSMNLSEYSAEDYRVTQVTTYNILTNATQRGGTKLVSSDGYTFVVKKKKHNGGVLWRCSVRNAQVTCPVTVQQEGDCFFDNGQSHPHPAKPGILTAVQIQQRVKSNACCSLFEPAPSIVDEILEEMVDIRQPEHSRPTYDSLVRLANRRRYKGRPADPSDLEFELNEDFIQQHTSGTFFRGDIRVGSRRHLLFATDSQLAMLSRAKTWYIDGTFKVVKSPFYQLLSIHCFVKSGESMKQLPGLFVIMAGKKKRDYKKVLQAAKELFVTPQW